MVAKEMGFEINSLEIEVNGTFNPAKFKGFDGDRAGFKSIEVTIRVDARVDDETLKEWIKRVEERCPVSDNLINETPTEITVKSLDNLLYPFHFLLYWGFGMKYIELAQLYQNWKNNNETY